MKRSIPVLSVGLICCTTGKETDSALEPVDSGETEEKPMVGIWEAEQFMGQEMPYTYTSDANNFSIMVDRLEFEFTENYDGSFYMRRVVYTDDGSEDGYSAGTVLLRRLTEQTFSIDIAMSENEDWLEDFKLDCQMQDEKLYCLDPIEEVDMLLVHE